MKKESAFCYNVNNYLDLKYKGHVQISQAEHLQKCLIITQLDQLAMVDSSSKTNN